MRKKTKTKIKMKTLIVASDKARLEREVQALSDSFDVRFYEGGGAIEDYECYLIEPENPSFNLYYFLQQIKERPNPPLVFLLKSEPTPAEQAQQLLLPFPYLYPEQLRFLPEMVKNQQPQQQYTESGQPKEVAYFDEEKAFLRQHCAGFTDMMDEALTQTAKAAKTRFPLNLFGPKGSGKTHLARLLKALLKSESFLLIDFNNPYSVNDLHKIKTHQLLKEKETNPKCIIFRNPHLAEEAAQYEWLQFFGDTAFEQQDFQLITIENVPKDWTQLEEDYPKVEGFWSSLKGVEVALPALKERKDDLLLIAQKILHDFIAQNRLPEKKLTKTAKKLLLSIDYPENIKDLSRFIKKAYLMADEEYIEAEDFEDVDTEDFFSKLEKEQKPNSKNEKTTEGVNLVKEKHHDGVISDLADSVPSFDEMSLKEISQHIVQLHLDRMDGDIPAVADKLAIGKSTIYRMIQLGQVKVD